MDNPKRTGKTRIIRRFKYVLFGPTIQIVQEEWERWGIDGWPGFPTEYYEYYWLDQ